MGQRQAFNIYTDLALEARELFKASQPDNEDGISCTEENYEDINITEVKILNEEGSRKLQKPVGTYVTIESQQMKENETECHERIIKILAQKLGEMHKLDKNGSALIVGLGNPKVTPDALGPKVISSILVTRHMTDIPSELRNKLRYVSAVTPGVMGTTGIETIDIIKGIVNMTGPDVVIAIDALAARRASRINATIQVSDTGIRPGGGMISQNTKKPKQLNEESLGVPIIAIGVPTVVDAATLVNDTLDLFINSIISETENSSSGHRYNDNEFYGMLRELGEEEKYGLISEILEPYVGTMFVTPKDVDSVVDRLANIIANAINIALHPGITQEDINRFIS